ncbi:MAG: DUF456 domain-containing protein [Patescibacteria group bacterium]
MDLGLTLVLIICGLIMMAGLFSIIFPYLPSIPLIWLGIFLFAVANKFEKIDEKFLLLMTVLLLVVILLDYMTDYWGAKGLVFSFWAILGAVIGGLIGSLFNIIWGLILGPLVGALLGEIMSGQDLAFAIKTKRYTIICYVAGTIIKISVGVAMVGLFIWKLTS